MTKLKNQGVKQKAWVEYLFPNLYTDGEDLSTLAVHTEAEVEKRIAHFDTKASMSQNLMKAYLRLVLCLRI